MTQHMESDHGRKPIEVSDECPTVSITRRLAHVHVGAPDMRVEELIRDAVGVQREQGNAAWTIDRELEAVRFALWQHAENGALYAEVMGGRV